MPRLIGLYSSAPQSGKSSVASYLSTYGYRTVSFASPLKAMLRSFLTHAGYTYDQVDDMLTPANKEKAIPEFGVSPGTCCRPLALSGAGSASALTSG